MIEDYQSQFYLFYALLCGATGIAYLKFRSLEKTAVTTKEFKIFQSSFLTGYSIVILCEFIAAASFYHTFAYLKLSLQQITKLYLTTVGSTTVVGVLMEIIDIGTRKDKCILSAILYSVSMFSIFFGGHKHFEMLMMGRIVYGAASSLHHSAFESYAHNGHSSLGFPDDWLAQTFSYLTHAMALMAALSGALGQVADSIGGEMGCTGICSVSFALAAAYIALMWEQDSNVPKFMLRNFTNNISTSFGAIRSNKQMLLLIIITSLCETSITIFTFYWAPWMTFFRDEQDYHIPYEIIFSSFIVASMLGNYLFQLYIHPSQPVGKRGSIEQTFQGILIGSSVSYFLGAVLQSSLIAFLVSVVVQLCMGSYFSCIGYLRAKIIMPELRNVSLIFSRLITLVLTVSILTSVHHSPFFMLSTCALMNGAAAYIQITHMELKEVDYDEVSSSDDE